MKTKLLSLTLTVLILGGLFLTGSQNARAENPETDQKPGYPYQKTFIISAYYSPLPQQKKYVTGSYDGDIRLNGGGVHGADGTSVYPGMVAATKSYAFGIKMKIPDVGIVAVHDRGGAIVHAGEKNQTHDRLDLWMGYGDAGLKRALNWGRRVVDVTIYGIAPDLKEEVVLNGYTDDEKFSVGVTDISQDSNDQNSVSENQTVKIQLFPDDLSFGDVGDEVFAMQQALQKLHYYDGDLNKNFDLKTQQSLLQFQIQTNIVDDETDFGAGYFGPQSRKMLESELKNNSFASTDIGNNPEKISTAVVNVKPVDVLAARLAVATYASQTEQLVYRNRFDHELKLGEQSEDVKNLQIELKNIHLLNVEPSGFFGETTRHALFKFQQSENIVEDEKSVGAGIFGPATRNRLNLLINAREQTKKIMSDRKKDETKVQIALKN